MYQRSIYIGITATKKINKFESFIVFEMIPKIIIENILTNEFVIDKLLDTVFSSILLTNCASHILSTKIDALCKIANKIIYIT